MHLGRVRTEATIVRRVFAAWSIEIPVSFSEIFVRKDGYWHAYDVNRSVSLTSLTVSDPRGPVSAELLTRQMPRPLEGTLVEELPPHLLGWAIAADALKPARASRMISGMLAAAGRLLIVTITSDDFHWSRGVWLSIRACAPQSQVWCRGRRVRSEG